MSLQELSSEIQVRFGRGGWVGPINFRRGTMKRIILAAAALGFIATPALADFWIVREGPTGPCRIVDVKPTDSKIIIVGNKAYKVRADADKDLAVVCK